jgi:Zn-dependent M32 family carboxypeptidase
MATVLEYSRDIAEDLQDFLGCDTPYDALVEFQTPGFVNPITSNDLSDIKTMITDRQVTGKPDLPTVPRDVMVMIIQGLVDVAAVDRFKTQIIENVAHPACLGYGGVPKGVLLGLTYDYDDPILGILTNWHEIGHAVYRQSIPNGRMIAGRAMDEAVAFLFEHVIGRSDHFLKLLLDAGLTECGYTMDMLRDYVRLIDKNTKRIETNPLRHILDIHICDQFERGMINGSIEAEDAEIEWNKLIESHADILPDDFHFYWDVHQMTGIYGDRAAYNPGLIAAFQLAEGQIIDVTTINEFVTQNISLCDEQRFDKAIETITGKPLSIDAFTKWIKEFYS